MSKVENKTEQFIEKARAVHSDKYDYSKVEYINTDTKVCIICPIHGEFWQSPYKHINLKRGCQKCGGTARLNTIEFIEKAKQVHGNKYDYSKVEYINNRVKVCIICPIHGEFWMIPSMHLSGHGCKECFKEKLSLFKTKTLKEFVEQAKKVHGDKYNYSKVNYTYCDEKVCIICPEHGEFWQTPYHHLNGQGCPKCGKKNGSIKKTKTLEQFIKRAREVHGDKYDYSKVNYINAKTKVCITCPEHGEFWQTPNSHLNGNGCPSCSNNKHITTEEFIKRSRVIHGDKYDYSKVHYINYNTKVCIICPEHGEFYQTPRKHLQGQGCPKCNSSKLEEEIRLYLEKNNIDFEEQKKFKWLGRQSLDFYLPQYNIAIECQGTQHFGTNIFFGGEKGYKEIISRDIKKYNLCKNNNIKLYYYSNIRQNYKYYVFHNKNKLLKEIKDGRKVDIH